MTKVKTRGIKAATMIFLETRLLIFLRRCHMADLKKDLTTLKDPSNIKNAFRASSPYALREFFKADPTIRRLITAGEKAVPLIVEETRKRGSLYEITLSAFAFIVENVKAEAAPQIFGALFQKSVEKLGPFFVHFAAHAIRSGLRLPINTLEMIYSRAELIETQDMLRSCKADRNAGHATLKEINRWKRVEGIKTAKGRELEHVLCLADGVTEETNPSHNPRVVQSYTHFDLELKEEKLGPTRRYNCHGFTFMPRRRKISSAFNVNKILDDNCYPVARGPFWPPLRPGDVICYYKEASEGGFGLMHTGRVWEVDSDGSCVKVRSKDGSGSEYVHEQDDTYITDAYGTTFEYYRQYEPLKGIGDLWIKDANWDDGNQYSYSLWASPDIHVDAPLYGSRSESPVFGVANHVWATVRNRGDTKITNARVRYYWAHSNVGLAPSDWNLIPGTPSHPNPTEPFDVDGDSSYEAPYVVWKPEAVSGVSDPATPCLLAIAYINDDPTDSDNPDPIVYPFNVRWDNNIAARSVHVISLPRFTAARRQLAIGLPFDKVEKIDVRLRFRLSFVPRLPIFGFPPKIVPPRVNVILGEQRSFSLRTAKEIEPFGKTWGPSVQPRDIDFELLRGRGGTAFLPRMNEKTVAWGEIKRLPLVAKESVPLSLEIAAPRTAQVGSNFYLRIAQEVRGEVTGCYTVVISIV